MMKKNITCQAKNKEREMEREWDSSAASTKKVEEFQEKTLKFSDKKGEIDHKIAGYKAQIDDLNKKIQDLEQEKINLAQTEEIPSPEVINQEVLKGLGHGENALKLESNIRQLKQNLSRLDSKIDFESTKLAYFRNNFPAL